MSKEVSDPEVECLKLKKTINENHRLAQKAAGDAVERAILAGELLGQWKELLPHGRFESFVEDHFEGSLRTAQVYLQAAKKLNALPKAQRTALLNEGCSIKGLLDFPKKQASNGKKPPTASVSHENGEPPEPKPDYGKCPNCAGTKWTEDENGVACSKCHHPHGESVGDVDEDRIGVQRSKTVKTCEALMRAFDDLNLLSRSSQHAGAIAGCKTLLTMAREWNG